MSAPASTPDIRALQLHDKLAAVGLGAADIAPVMATPRLSGDAESDAAAFAPHWRAIEALQERLGGVSGKGEAELAAILALRRHACDARTAFLDRHATAVYDRLSDARRRFLRADALLFEAARRFPGLAPTRAELAGEAGLKQGDKFGREIAQGVVLSKFLADPVAGHHLCHAMLLPLTGASEALAKFRRDSRLELGKARLERRGAAVVLTHSHPATLNAEDDTTLPDTELAVDVALMDPDSRLCVLRGGPVDHPKHGGRRLFGSGINLTHIYRGRISYLFYLLRDLGYVNKLYRGLAVPDRDPDEVAGGTSEKLWIAAVEGFAIGGACQLLLATDYVIGEAGAYASLPARKEGIIPGAANLRLPRFLGDRLARQAIMYERRIDCDTDEGRLLFDEVVPAGALDGALDTVADRLATSGVVSAEGNRRALRVGAEPLDLFRRYMATYAREQAFCHFSPALLDNLERYWNAHNRRAA